MWSLELRDQDRSAMWSLELRDQDPARHCGASSCETSWYLPNTGPLKLCEALWSHSVGRSVTVRSKTHPLSHALVIPFHAR
jgi:hypothetical protein